MPAKLDRREVLGATAAVLAAMGLAGTQAPALADDTDPGQDPPVNLPPVPGMSGDRRANEMWYQFDQRTYYAPVPGLVNAYLAINSYAADKGGVDLGPLIVWLETIKAPGYPKTFRDWATPISEPLAFISNVMLTAFDDFYGRRSPHLTRAFAYFAEGVLYDPRRLADNDPVHSMDGNPPLGWAVWYAYARAMILLGIGHNRWREIAPLLGFGCALQLELKTDPSQLNPPPPPYVVRDVARAMLPLDLRRLDAFFLTFPYPPQLPTSAAARLGTRMRRLL